MHIIIKLLRFNAIMLSIWIGDQLIIYQLLLVAASTRGKSEYSRHRLEH